MLLQDEAAAEKARIAAEILAMDPEALEALKAKRGKAKGKEVAKSSKGVKSKEAKGAKASSTTAYQVGEESQPLIFRLQLRVFIFCQASIPYCMFQSSCDTVCRCLLAKTSKLTKLPILVASHWRLAASWQQPGAMLMRRRRMSMRAKPK
jgi:hypothetical protein